MTQAGARPLDLICIGRAGVDFYAQQIGSRLEDAASFAKYIGGSSTNIAACSARMGLRSALYTRVGNDHMGRFIREQLQREGVDTSHVITDPQRLTAMVVLGIEDRETFPLIFVRENCADMAIAREDFDEPFIASAHALLITGTHFSTPQTYEVCRHALALARANGVRTALDIDYRPVLWGLTGRDDGETRFIADDGVSAHLQSILPEFDLIVGTEEEMHIAGASTDNREALRRIREITPATLVLKRGPYGASVFPAAIPDDLDEGIRVAGVNVEVMNVLGAGDGFMAGFLRGWIRDEGHEQALRYANACGALVVSRHGCTPAMPTVEELDFYLANSERIPRPDVDPELNYLHRVTTRRGQWLQLNVLAFDHRAQLVEMARECGAGLERLAVLKQLLVDTVAQAETRGELQGRVGIVCDDRFGYDALTRATGRGWFVARPVEQPGSRPLEFEGGDSIGSRLIAWPTEQTVKCLVHYHPDDPPALRWQQEKRLLDLYRACGVSGHELMLEIVPPAGDGDPGEAVWRSVQRLYNLEIRPDWWKLQALPGDWLGRVGALIHSRAPHCRGILILGQDAPLEELAAGFERAAAVEQVRGFAVGRSLFARPARRWLEGELDDAGFGAAVLESYLELAGAWQAAAGRAGG